MSEKKYWTGFNIVDFDLPENAVIDCHHQGACDEDVAYWQKKLDLQLDREDMIKELKEYGAWEEKELQALDNSSLEEKLIWLGAGNIQDQDEDWERDNG